MAVQKYFSKCALAPALGLTAAVYVFFAGITSWLFGWGTSLVEVMSSLYIGYAASLPGAVIGAGWAFADGFIGGLLISWLYNKFQPQQIDKTA